MITVALPKAQAGALLPAGLELGDQSATPPALHPVGLAFGRNKRVRLSNMPRLFDLDYLESSISVPWVRRWGQTPLTYTPRLFLDNLPSVLGGLLVWGFNKELARLRWGPDTFQVETFLGGQRLIDVQFETKGELRDPAAFPNFAPFLGPAMAQTKVEKTMLGRGPFVYSTLDWGGGRGLQIRPVEATVEVRRQFLPGLLPGVYRAQGIDQTPLGAFEFSTEQWQLSFPRRWPGAEGRKAGE